MKQVTVQYKSAKWDIRVIVDGKTYFFPMGHLVMPEDKAKELCAKCPKIHITKAPRPRRKPVVVTGMLSTDVGEVDGPAPKSAKGQLLRYQDAVKILGPKKLNAAVKAGEVGVSVVDGKKMYSASDLKKILVG